MSLLALKASEKNQPKAKAIAKVADRVIYLDTENVTGLKRFGIKPSSTHKFHLIPNMEDVYMENKGGNKRDTIYIAAPAGSGKSYQVADFARRYRKLYPKRKIYLFSLIKDDPAFEDIPKIIHYNDKDFLDQLEESGKPLEMEDYAKSLVIFDDIDQLEDDVRKKMTFFRDRLLELGRHNNISVITTAHTITNYKQSRTLLNEADWVIFFPRSNFQSIRRYLKEYRGLDREQMNKIKHAPSRWTAVYQKYPTIIMNENEIYIP